MRKEDIFDEVDEKEGLEKACEEISKVLGVNKEDPIIIIYTTKSGHVRIVGTTDCDPIIASFLDWIYQFKQELFDMFVNHKIQNLVGKITGALPNNSTKH